MLKVLLTPVFYLLWKVEVEGREHIPTEGPAVLAANHQSFCDSFFLPLVLRRRVTYVAKSEYFEHWRTAWFFRAAGQIPMQRGGGDASQRALNTAMEVLDKGDLLAIYPEGTRAPDVRLHRGHTGVARLSLNCDVPIIPVGIIGTRAVQPPGSRFMRPFRKVTVRFGPPVTCPGAADAASATDAAGATGAVGATLVAPGQGNGSVSGTATGAERRLDPLRAGDPGRRFDPERRTDPDRAGDPGRRAEDAQQIELRRLTDALMAEIAALSGQEYVDHYARRTKSP
jgi:1-acyl-sn-glycerol-3-phosphate acyltransferase